MRTEHVKSGIALSCDLAPVGNRKQFGKALHAGNKMIFQVHMARSVGFV